MRRSLVLVAVLACEQPAAVAPVRSPAVVVAAKAPGLDATNVQRWVAAPLEIALAGASRLATLRSRTTPGRVELTLEAVPGTDEQAFVDEVGKRIGDAVLPKDVLAPEVRRVPRAGIALQLAIHANDGVAARAWADAAVQAIEHGVGVGDVRTCGGARVETVVTVDPERLRAGSASFDEIVGAVRDDDGGDPRALAALPSVRDVASVAVRTAPLECRAADLAAPDVVSIAVWARRDRDGVRARALAALPPVPAGMTLERMPQLEALTVAGGELAAVRAVLARHAELGEVVLEQGTTDDAGRLLDPHAIRVFVAPDARLAIADAVLVGAGYTVLDRSQTIVELRGADREALERTADDLARMLHVVARALPAPSMSFEIDRERATVLGVPLPDIEAALVDVYGDRHFPSFSSPGHEVVLVVAPGASLLDIAWVPGVNGDRIGLSTIVRSEVHVEPGELLDVGRSPVVPAVDLRVADAAAAIRAALAAHPLPAGVTLELRASPE